ncbi:MAG: hypothetical protein RL017_655 [Pseudomonadota bacterium]|nr:aminotransferase class I/II-fold pyridoxal phosphate-dependent enzyme [Burkholderiales bacterium]
MTNRYAKKNLASSFIATRNIHSGTIPDPYTGAILPPIYQTATYALDEIEQHKGYTYSRVSNPGVTMLENRLAGIEDALGAICFATGMAATTTLLLTFLSKDDHLICSDVVYGGTVRLIEQLLNKYGIHASFVDASDPNKVKQAIKKNTKLILIETPANPTLKLNNISKISKIAQEHKIPIAVDNTFLTASIQQPLRLGADIVLYSTTKYIDGHNATVGGALISNNSKMLEDFDFNRKTVGSIQSPFNAWLILQGVKTLDLRMKQHSENAIQVASFLENHKKVSQIFYPGLKSFPQYDLAQEQHMGGYHGGMLCFEVNGGMDKAIEVMNKVTLCTLAESLGSVETLITHPATMTHKPIEPSVRQKIGISDGLIRLSVGLEHYKDIINDLNQALK